MKVGPKSSLRPFLHRALQLLHKTHSKTEAESNANLQLGTLFLEIKESATNKEIF